MKKRLVLRSAFALTATALLLGLVGCEMIEPPSGAEVSSLATPARLSQVSPLQTPLPPTSEREPTPPSDTWPTLTPPPTLLPPPQWTPVIKPTPTPKLLPTRPPLRLSPTPVGSPPANLQSLYYMADNAGVPELRVMKMDAQGRKWSESRVAINVDGGVGGLHPSPDGKYLALETGGMSSVLRIVERSSGRT
jgi:hypothetical protein